MGNITEKATEYSIVSSIVPQAVSSDTVGTGVDLKSFNSAFVVASLGAETGTLSGSNKIEFILEHSDDNSTFTAVTTSGEAGGFTISGTGIFATVDAPAEAPGVYKVPYTGIKRYIRVTADVSGTISIPLGVNVHRGDGILPQA